MSRSISVPIAPSLSPAALSRLTKAVADGEPVYCLNDLGLHQRTCGLLEHNGFDTLESLLMASPQTVLGSHGIGKKLLEDVYKCLAEFDRLDEARKALV